MILIADAAGPSIIKRRKGRKWVPEHKTRLRCSHLFLYVKGLIGLGFSFFVGETERPMMHVKFV
jgi:hypothetical protein